MDNYSYLSEKQAIKTALWKDLEKYSEDVLEFYLQNGFDNLAIMLRLPDDWSRRVVFDYLMIEKKAVLSCIRRNKVYFLRVISEGNGKLLRPMLGLKASKYDLLWKEALDLLNLYFVERKVDDKLFNLSLEKFFENSILNEKYRQID